MHIDPLARLRDAFGWGSLAVAVWAVASLVMGSLLSWLSRRALARLAARTSNTWDDELVRRIGGPLTMGWGLLLAYLTLSWLALAPAAEDTARHVLQVTFVAALFWVLFRSIDVADHLLGTSHWAQRRATSRSLIALASRGTKFGIVIVGVITVLSQAGYPVGGLIAGLGIGGLALALGAQKTLENVFGAFSLAVDEPFHLGDFVRIDGILGNIEAIGLRSTRIRTLDRTLVTIPNGKLAEMRTESYSARDRLRLACTVSLVYQTTSEQLRGVLEGLEAALRAHPKIWTGAVIVRLAALAPSSMDIEIMAWFNTQEWGEFQGIRQEILLRFVEVVEGAGTSFAYPTQTLHVQQPVRRA